MLSVAVSILLSSLGMVSRDMPLAHCAREPSETVAAYVPGEITLDAAHPAAQWNKARPIVFCSGRVGIPTSNAKPRSASYGPRKPCI